MNTRQVLSAGLALTLSVSTLAGCNSPNTPAPTGTEASRHLAALAEAVTATASHTNGSFAASRAVDGDTNTEWQSGAVSNPSLTLTMPASGELLELAIKANPNVGTYNVEVSEYGIDWTVVLADQKNTSWNVETKKLPEATKGKLVRLTFANGGKNVMVFEVTVKQGALSAPVAAPSPDTLTAAASHTNGSYAAGRAIDGDTNTEWQSGAVSNPTLTVTLPGAFELNELAIKTNPGAGTYAVETSLDGAAWTAALSNQSNSTWGVETKRLPAGTKGKFVRLKFTNGGKNVMVFEATVKTGAAVSAPAPTTAPTTAPTAVPTTAPTTAPVVSGARASHTNGSYAASRAMDGDVNTEWQSGAVSNPWLILDRGASASLTGIGVKTNPGFGSYSVETSDDGVTFKPLLSNQANSTWGVETKAVPAGASGRFLRFQFANGGKNVMVFEVQAAGGTSTAPTPAPTVAPTTAPAPSGAFKTYFGNQSVPKVGSNYDRGFQLINELGMTTIREGWNWKYIESNKNQYVSWMDLFDQKMDRFAQNGVKVQAMITDTPDWASSDPKYTSKTYFDAASLGKYTVPAGLSQPIFADGTDVYKPGVKPNPNNYYAEYIYDLATRYKGKIHAYQVWNEPDFPSGDLGAGTTGSTGGTRYWTGSVQDYVRLLKVSHTLVKGIDPAAKITLGGLGYEKYLAAIIDNGGAGYFDVLDFHAYGTDKTSSNGVLNSAWGFLGRYNAMKQVLTSKGVTGKTFAVSETGFTADNQQEQASYVAKVFATAVGLGDVEMVQWAVFMNPGHLNIGLIDQSTLSVKTQGYHAYTYATSQLSGATAAGTVTGTGVQGYKLLRKDGKTLYVVWSTTASASVTLPLGSGQVFDKFGAARSASFANGQVTLSLTPSPIYVVGP